MRSWLFGGAMLACGAVAGCTDEVPTEVGDGLLPSGLVRTYEVVLDAGDYLVGDSAFSGYVDPAAAPFLVVAHEFGGALDSRALARFVPPSRITVRDTMTSILRVDSMPRLLGGDLVITFDTIRFDVDPALQLRLSRLAEVWDPLTTTWDLRVDSGATHLPWSQPGGTTSGVVGGATWDLGEDSVVIAVDSLTLRAWQDSTDLSQGALIESLTAGTRARIVDMTLRVEAASSISDTVVTVDVRSRFPTFIFEPVPPSSASEPRVGGLPSWRTVLQLRDRLDELQVPCPPGSPVGCTLPLSETAITYAALVLQPMPPPPGFIPEDSVVIGALPLLVSNNLPVARSPLAAGAPATTARLAPARLADPDVDPIELAITGFLAVLAAPPTENDDALPPFLALLQQPEGLQIGFVRFEEGPKLRLILTTAATLEIR